jgi:multidrug efflux pump subunit AcrB
VAGASLVGPRDRRILIEADRSRMESLGLSLGELIRTIQAQNATIPGGTLNTESREYLLRTVGRVDTAEEFGAVIVRRGSGSGEGLVRVRDVAAITEGFDERGVYARFNGEEAVTIRVSKVARGNSIAVIEGVKEQVEAFRKTLRPGIDITLSGDSTVQIKESIRVLLNNAVFGLFLLTGILFLFVGIRNALMTALGIPVTFALTFLILEAFGETLNSNTLFGLVLVLGLIVDHAIVITENSYRLQQEGLSRHDAAIQGTNQVVLPVLAGTLTTVAAFLPLMISRNHREIPPGDPVHRVHRPAGLDLRGDRLPPLPLRDWPGGKVKRDRRSGSTRYGLSIETYWNGSTGERGFPSLSCPRPPWASSASSPCSGRISSAPRISPTSPYRWNSPPARRFRTSGVVES